MMERPMDAYPSVGSYVAGRYRIDAVLGEGGMGAVFRAADAEGKLYALKFPAPEIRSRPGMMSRFANEAVAASRIASEHAVKIYGVEATEAGVPFITMELLEGTDLDRVIEQESPIPIFRAVHFALQILRALQVAHAAGVVHRDMKPANCFVINHNGEADFVKLIDFGITKLLDDNTNKTATSVTMGTPAYMAPEQARSAKAAEPRSDLYSVGVILYELLTKKRPYEGDSNNEMVVKIITEPPMPIRQVRPDLPEELASAVEHALVKIPAARYASAQEFARRLSQFSDARSAGVLARIEAGAAAPSPMMMEGQLAPTNPVTPPPGGGSPKTAIMEPGAFIPDPAPMPQQSGGKTVMADAPINVPPPVVASGLPQSGGPAIIPAPASEYSDDRGGGGGNGVLFAVLGVLVLGLIGGGLYYGGVFSTGGGSASSQPTAAPPAADEEEVEEDDGEGHKVKKKKKKQPAADPTAPAPDPLPEPGKPVIAPTTKPTTTTTAKPTTTVDGGTTPVPSTTTSGTTTAPTIILPPGWPSATTTTPPPATTTPPPATTTPPPATTTPPPATTTPPPAGTVPPIILPKKPKLGGS
jgi:hypothetical protein